MSAHVPRFLNLPANSDPFALLGITPAQCTPVKIETALIQRIGRTYNHPDSRSPDADEVRQLLRDAAAKLKDPVQRELLAARYRPPHVRPMLTPFDREALAILVGSGGWNAVSRSRLVSLAQHHGIAAQGLMKVISGLSHYARTGAGHLETADITAGRQRIAMHAGRTAWDRIGQTSDSIIEKYAPELREESASATVKLSIAFGLFAIVLAIFFVRMLVPQPQPPIPHTTVDPGLVPAELRAGDRDRKREPGEGDRETRLISFERMPTFALDLPDAVADHAAASANVLEELKDIARRLAITDQPSERVYHLWEAAINDVAHGWLLLDDDLLDSLDAGMADVLYHAADSPAVSERFMRQLHPAADNLASGGGDPITLISGSWRIKQLARIIQRTDLPPILSDHARTGFSAAGGDALVASIDRDPPERCASAWLNHAVPDLLDRLAYDEDALLQWELWIAAQYKLNLRQNGLRGDLDRNIFSAVHGLIDSTVELSPNKPGAQLLGRLVSELDLSRSAQTRRDILAMIENERLDVNRLAIFTAVLAMNPDAAWMDKSLLLPLNADDVMRRRVRQDMEKAWPAIDDVDDRRRVRTTPIDPEAAKRWHELQGALVRESLARDPVEQMRQLTAAAQLNQAAAWLSADDEELIRRGRRALDELHEQASQAGGFRSRSASRRSPTNLNPRGSAPAGGATGVHGGIGRDGGWAADYEAAGRNQTERLRQLSAMQQMGGDLGPLDAAMFVREVYRATPIEVREEAQLTLISRFPRGVTVAMLMLDLFPEAPRTDMTGDLIARYTGSVLPSVKSESWRREARLALVTHAVVLRGSGETEIDDLASVLEDIALSEGGTVDPSRRHVQSARTTTDAAHKRYLAWRGMARAQLPNSIPVPGDLTTLDRRHHNRLHFAQSPIQAYVALTISTLELAAYVTSAEQPALSEALNELLRHASDQRVEAEELLAQAILAERAITDVWRLRIGRERGENRLSSGISSGIALGMVGALAPEAAARPRRRPMTEPENDRRREQLESLDPRTPQQYFELAEDLADAAITDRERELARRLFALAGVLAPERYGRSAALALAQMAERRADAERLRAVANLLDPYAGVAGDRDPAEIGNETREAPAALDLGEAFSAMRLGRSNRAVAILQHHAVADLLDQLAHADAVDPRRLIEDARSGRRPRDLTSPRVDSKLLIELALLAGAERPWTADLILYERRPLIEVDEDILRHMLGPNADRPYYRDNRWVRRP